MIPLMYTVYCHLFPNGKRYIGITRTSTERRWGKGKNYKTCLLVNRAIQKYGWENIEHTVIETVDTKEQAEEIEKFYIALFRTDEAEYGYNILPGGDVATNDADDDMRKKLGNGWRGKHRSEYEKKAISKGVKEKFSRAESNGHFGMKANQETKKKMSESQKKGWENNEERRKKASEAMKKRMADGEYREKIIKNLNSIPKRKPGEYKTSEKTKAILSEKMKGRFRGANSPTSKPVLQYEKDGTFVKRWENAGEAERAGIAQRKSISLVCNRHKSHYTAGGYIWRFEGDEL